MLNLSQSQQTALSIVQAAIWNKKLSIAEDVDWTEIEKFSKEQGVASMLVGGSKLCSANVPEEILKRWYDWAFVALWKNERINAVQKEVLQWLSRQEIPAAVLKGTSCARYYWNPDIRRLGDIDLLVDRGDVDRVASYLVEQGFQASDHDAAFHVCFFNKNAAIEIHFAGTDVPDGKGGDAVREIMNHFLEETYIASMAGASFPVLADYNQAIMLILHMERHMLENGVGLRQLCDWTLFVNSISDDLLKDRISGMLEKCGLLLFAKVITSVCVKYLGLDESKVPWGADIPEDLTDQMMEEILRGGSVGAADQEGMGSLFFDRRSLGKGEESKVVGLLTTLTRISYENFPWMQRCRFLLPLAWVYLPLRYVVRSLCGKRPRKNISNVMSIADRRLSLYRKLKLYEVK